MQNENDKPRVFYGQEIQWCIKRGKDREHEYMTINEAQDRIYIYEKIEGTQVNLTPESLPYLFEALKKAKEMGWWK